MGRRDSLTHLCRGTFENAQEEQEVSKHEDKSGREKTGAGKSWFGCCETFVNVVGQLGSFSCTSGFFWNTESGQQ